jgi:hypothetical protein
MDARIIPDQVGDRRPGMTSVYLLRDSRYGFAISRPDMPEFYPESPALLIRGRRECRAPDAPAAARGVVVSTRVSHHGHTGKRPAFPAQWF